MTEQLNHASRAARVIRRLGDEVVVHPSLDHIRAIFREEDYHPSQRIEEQLSTSFGLFLEHFQARSSAQAAYSADHTGTRTVIAEQLGCKPEDMGSVLFHPTSVSIVLKKDAFEKKFQEIEKDKTGNVPPAGFTSSKLLLLFNGQRLPYSLLKRRDMSTANHEADHVDYRYFHPLFSETPVFTRAEYRNLLQEEAEQIISSGEIEEIRPLVQTIMYAQLYLYLTELASEAGEKRGAYERFWTPGQHYLQILHNDINALMKRFSTEPLDQQLHAQLIIFQETKTLKQKMAYIEDRYKKLVQTGVDPKDLKAAVTLLTPENGYIMNAFLQREEPTRDQLRKWIYEYHGNATQEELQQGGKVWEEFILWAKNIGPREYFGIRASASHLYQQFQDIVHSRKIVEEQHITKYKDEHLLEHLATAIDLDLAIRMKTIVQRRTTSLQAIFQSDFFHQQVPDKSRRESIMRGVILEALDFHEVFYEGIDASFPSEDVVQHQVQPSFIAIRDYVIARSFHYDDLAEEIAERVMSNHKIDFRQLFSKYFQRRNYKRERTITVLEAPEEVQTSDLSPLEEQTFRWFHTYVLGENPPPSKHDKSIEIQSAKISSLLIRVLYWARKENLSAQKVAMTRQYLSYLMESQILPKHFKHIAQELIDHFTAGSHPRNSL